MGEFTLREIDILTQPRSPTTTGKIEPFHRTLRIEFNTRQVFKTLKAAQEALDEWVSYYNTQRPHQALADATPESRSRAVDDQPQHPVDSAGNVVVTVMAES